MTEVIAETPATEPAPEAEKPAPTGEELEKLEADIIRQIEYYFGDANLVRDKFLQEQITKDDGWVPFDVLFTFKRLAALSTNVDVVCNALQKSEEGLIEVSEDKTKIRRHPEHPVPELNEERRKEIASRTAYSKGFPVDAEMSDLIDFFAPYEKVVNIVMRKYHDKPTKTYKFKGSVFVTFAKKEQCEDYINKEKVEYKGTDIIRKWQEKYLEDKKEERSSKKKNKKQPAEPEINLPKGAVIHFEGCGDSTTWEQVKEAIVQLGGEVAYIEYTRGDKSGYVRLQQENSAQPFLDKVEDKKIKLADDTELTLRTLTEEEEKEFLKKAVEHMKSRRNNQNKRKFGNNRKRRPEAAAEDEPPAKKDDK
ncbi:unnamed protein product [Hermetia illucens]|uniref:La protein homolog n=1 Tax=Hermetia illucens TaxID=343691 RepID=A0A7R8UF23_HERIL|nr:la protein homolog [Hermetia illucens]CAD7079610.1 unnamed protein product [Hermetia illucens]